MATKFDSVRSQRFFFFLSHELAGDLQVPVNPTRSSNMLDLVILLYLNQLASRSDANTAEGTFWHEHPIASCLGRAHSVRERRSRRRLLSAHARRTNDRLEGFTGTWRGGNVVRQARQGWVRDRLWCTDVV